MGRAQVQIKCAEGASLYVQGKLHARAAAQHAKITCTSWNGLAVDTGGSLDIEDVGKIQTWKEMMLWTILVVLCVLWLWGLIGGVGGNLIHLLLIVALVMLIFNLIGGRRVTR